MHLLVINNSISASKTEIIILARLQEDSALDHELRDASATWANDHNCWDGRGGASN